MEKIGSYAIIELLFATRSSIIYRARKNGDSNTVIIKILKSEYFSPSEIARFKHQYDIIRQSHIDGIIKTFDVVPSNQSLALVLEDFDGITLRDLIQNEDISLFEFLKIAISLAQILGAIHSNNIIHKDIKPNNILINRDSGTIKITNFGISSEFLGEHAEIFQPEMISVTLPYISPEQTGRMNRAVDYRTDLYSLGVTFYYMLTGTVPFKSDDPLEIIHAHIAKKPVSLDEFRPSIPRTVSNIVMKLLAKTAEERYQNSFGLMADLQSCLKQLERSGSIEDFEIGQHDIAIGFNIIQKLYGRDTELRLVMDAFGRVSDGASEIALAYGQPGIGKSSLIQELYKPITARRGYFIRGKYDQLKKDVPYSSIMQAFQGLIRQILTESEERIAIWKNRLLSALGASGKVITDIIPELQLIIGAQPDVPVLNPEESRHRFNLVFKNFVHVFTTEDHPLAIFLDDLQWADMASLNLIQTIITDQETKYLFLIGAYRDNEVDPHHPLSITLDEIRKSGKTITGISLGPLNATDVNKMIMNVLRCKAEESIDLADIVHRKTGGNPFFVNQFLKNLYDNKILELDPQTGWKWDTDNIKQIQVTDNVVELMAGKISTLPKNTQNILKTCACIGNLFDLELLSVVSGKSIDEILADLASAIQEHLVSMYDDMYKFCHDRIQEAVYSFIPDDIKAEMHYRIGKNVLKKTDPQKLDEKLFYIVDQLNRGIKHVTEFNERLDLMNLNQAAAVKAKKSAAYATAANNFETGISLLSREEWTSIPGKFFELSLEHAESTLQAGNIEKASELCEQLFKIAENNLERGFIHNLKANILEFQSENLELVINEVRKALQLYNIFLPADQQEIERMLEESLGKMREHLSKTPIEDLVNLPEMMDKEKVMALNLLFRAVPSAHQSNPPLFCLIESMMFDMELAYGTTAISCKNFADVGIIYASAFADYDAAYRLSEAAFALINKYQAESLKPPVYFVFAAFISHWRVHYTEGLEYFTLCQQFGLKTGDLAHVAYAACNKILRFLYVGNKLEECNREAKNTIDYLGKLHAVVQVIKAKIVLNTILKLQISPDSSEYSDVVIKDDDLLIIIKESKNAFAACEIGQCNTMVCYLLDYPEAAEQWNAYTEPFIPAGSTHFPTADHYLFQSLIHAKKWKTALANEQKSIMEVLLKNHEKLKHWSDNCPSNFSHKYYLLSAEIAVIREESLETITGLYKKAIDSIGKDDFIHMRALVNELQGNFWLEKGYATIGRAFIQEAYYLYKQWGAAAKVNILEKKYIEFLPRGEKKAKTAKDGNLIDSKTLTIEGIDLQTVIKISHALSSEIDIDRLIARLLEIAIENAGAQKGCILVENEIRLWIDTETKVDLPDGRMPAPSADGSSDLPQSVINYAKRTGKYVVLSDASHDPTYSSDPCIIKRGIKSVLCMPIKEQNNIIGILYLENNLSNDAFTADRINILDVLTSQAAISLKNALLYTERKQAQEQLLAEKERLSVTLRSIGEGVIATGTDKLITLMSKVAEQLTGWTQNEAIGRTFTDVFRMVDENTRTDILADPLDAVFTKSAVMEISQTPVLVGRDGTEKIVAYTVAPISDHLSNIIGAIIVFRDITEKQRMENEMLKSQKLESLSVFAGGIAHDFNNILTGVIGNVSLALTQMKPDDEQFLRLSQVEKASLRARDLTHQLLTFSMGGNPIKRSTFIAALLRESAHFALSGTSIKCEFAISEDLWPVDADEGQINQVINNLIINATQAMPDGGIINIKAQNTSIDGRSALPLSPGEYIKISIRDEGIGIPKENLQKIFDPFFTTKPKGTGLGLSSTFSIIKKHGGHITVESRVEKGSTFHIYLPASENKTPVSHSDAVKEHIVGTGRVLVMDDEEIIRKTACNILMQLGFDAEAVLDGEGAIVKYKEALASGRPYDLVIMDLTVPGRLGGKETIQRLIAIDPDVKAIASSGYSNDPIMHDFERYGFSGIIVKPYRVIDMREAVWKILK